MFNPSDITQLQTSQFVCSYRPRGILSGFLVIHPELQYAVYLPPATSKLQPQRIHVRVNPRILEHGLIASLTDIGRAAPGPFQFNVPWTSLPFASTTVPAPFATSTVDGLTNTAAIIAQNGSAPDTAATLCAQYSVGVYNDWYLPSYYELDLCYNAAFLVNKVLGVNGFRLGGYWSSTELSASNVLLTFFNQGYATPGATKSNGNFVRAVRRF
jgi:hypothetical protein